MCIHLPFADNRDLGDVVVFVDDLFRPCYLTEILLTVAILHVDDLASLEVRERDRLNLFLDLRHPHSLECDAVADEYVGGDTALCQKRDGVI